MSGRSAYVRKKITESKTGEKGILGIVNGRGWSRASGARIAGNNCPTYDSPIRPGTSLGASHARYPTLTRKGHGSNDDMYRPERALILKSTGASTTSETGVRESEIPSTGPMPDFAYARARKLILKTDDVSGIERSGFRNAVDKKSSHIRKGLTKAFSLGLKKKKDVQNPDPVPSLLTMRAQYFDPDNIHDTINVPTVPTHLSFREMLESEHHQTDISPPPTAKLPPTPAFAPTPIKRWIGGGRPIQRWNKLRKDPELWDPNGDVLVYLGPEDQPQLLNPSFRLSSHILEATESRFLVTLLREGSTESDYSQSSHSASPVGAPPMLHSKNSYPQLERTGQGSEPVSEENVRTNTDGQISYKISFSIPTHLSKAEAHCHAITTRNVFALLNNASLVGTSLFQALQDLLDRLSKYMQPGADNVRMIVNYLSTRGIDDVRNDPETAVSILAWSETPSVRWEEGWRESFLHCAGMYSRLENCADYKHLTPITRALLERACLETQLRVHAAEERLVAFAYADIWPTTGPATNSAGKAAADRLQHFLIRYYTKICGTWPPIESGTQTTEGEMWLTRRVAQMLQRDFAALYDYLVNRDIVWDESETRSTRKWMMVSESGNKSFEADTEDLPLTDILIEFDNRMRFPHIPHPYPLVPEPISPVRSPTSLSARDRPKRDKNARQTADDRTLERRIQLAYTEATNIYSLGSEFAQSDLLDNFVKFEKSDRASAVNLSLARRARWALIYTILQTLASVSVDAPNVRFKDGVSYHLSPRLKGATRTPPWKGATSQAAEASHELSHCWLAPHTWPSTSPSADSDTNSVTSASTDTAMRLMRDRLRRFPRPPQSVTTTGRSSNAGWHALSVRSSGAATPTMWGGSSAMSVSNFSDDVVISSSGRMISVPECHAAYSQKILPPLPLPLPLPPPRSPRREDDRIATVNAQTTMGSLDAHFKEGGGEGARWPGEQTPYIPPQIPLC